MMSKTPERAALPPPVLYVSTILIALALSYALPVPLPNNDWSRALAIALILFGEGLSFWAMWRFRQEHTTASNFSTTAQLLQDGPFRLSRNPINLGDTCAYIGLALLMGSLWPWLFLPGVIYLMNRLVIRPDEKELQEQFGETYRAYCRRVRRWL
jgi:protein-S-isoprenylcysteine O-methyltransferase Ste14